MTVLLETQRLWLRPWNPETEAEAAFRIYGDPEVMRWIGSGAYEADVESLREKIRKRNGECDRLGNGTGFWAIAPKSATAPVGTVILKQLPDGTGQVTLDWEVGWHLRRDAWGKGYATEAGQAIVKYGFEALHLSVIYAIAYPENLASIRVMQRLGMTNLGHTDRYYGRENLTLYGVGSGESGAE
jgi:RimJ/RimL family protein N-acetyltransferase